MARTLGWAGGLALVGSLVLAAWAALAAPRAGVAAEERPSADLALRLRYRQETKPGSGRFHALTRAETWPAAQTAVIVCDMWDAHHCLNAVRREAEFAPRLERALRLLRARGVVVVHAPSSCMEAYAEHPARQRAVKTPRAKNMPADIAAWCRVIPAEEKGVYPIDQSDGGEDDDPEEHRQWAAKLQAEGRNPRAPWKKQIDVITIADDDYISDNGEEVWSVLEARGVKHVLLAGVHTNMCVLGRPFGLRQMAKNGKSVALIRDLTDTMYNPARRPFVSHFTGTDLIVEHIEKFVCPTISSEQILGDGKPFRFAGDKRPRLAVVIAEDEYETHRTLPEFVARRLGHDFSTELIFGSESERNNIPGLEALGEADALLLSARRRALPKEQLAIVRAFVAAGKPVVGVRTSSHAFDEKGAKRAQGLDEWPEFDKQVFGGNYHGHLGQPTAEHPTLAYPDVKNRGHAIFAGVTIERWNTGGSLYKTAPVADTAQVLLWGRDARAKPDQPAAWLYARADGAVSFYTSLGHKDDFANEEFEKLLLNALRWTAHAKAAP